AVAEHVAVVQVAEDTVANAIRVLLNQSFRLPVAVRILFAVALDLDAWVAHFHAHRYFVDAVRAHGGARIVRVHGRAVEIARAREAHLVAEPPDSNRDRIPVEGRHGANLALAVRVPGGQASVRVDVVLAVTVITRLFQDRRRRGVGHAIAARQRFSERVDRLCRGPGQVVAAPLVRGVRTGAVVGRTYRIEVPVRLGLRVVIVVALVRVEVADVHAIRVVVAQVRHAIQRRPFDRRHEQQVTWYVPADRQRALGYGLRGGRAGRERECRADQAVSERFEFVR